MVRVDLMKKKNQLNSNQKLAPKPKRRHLFLACLKFTSTWLNVLQRMYINMSENMLANGALEKMPIGRVLVSVSTPRPLVPTLFGGEMNQSHFLSPTGIVSLYSWGMVNSLNHGHTHTNNATLKHPTCGKICQSPRSRLPHPSQASSPSRNLLLSPFG